MEEHFDVNLQIGDTEMQLSGNLRELIGLLEKREEKIAGMIFIQLTNTQKFNAFIVVKEQSQPHREVQMSIEPPPEALRDMLRDMGSYEVVAAFCANLLVDGIANALQKVMDPANSPLLNGQALVNAQPEYCMVNINGEWLALPKNLCVPV